MANPRIISGKAKGMRLAAVPGDTTRPITDRVKEALFNILGQDIVGSVFLDLFAGTGSVGIEALSRGASFVLLNDRHRLAVTTIHANLKHTRLGDSAQVSQLDAFGLLSKTPAQLYDYVFIAPPQYKNMWVQAIQTLDNHPEILSESAWAIVQIDPVEYAPLTLNNLAEFDQRKYGSTLLIFYKRTIHPPDTEKSSTNLSSSS